jgi:uncharacterized protein (TIGR03435 family)
LPKAKIEEKDCPEVSTPEVNCHMFRGGQGQGIHSKTVSVADMVTGLENFTDRPLIDRTDFKGLFDIDTKGWVPMRPRPGPVPGTEPSAEDRAFADPARPTLQQVLDKVGLRLEIDERPGPGFGDRSYRAAFGKLTFAARSKLIVDEAAARNPGCIFCSIPEGTNTARAAEL